jgi:hypothetical protein
MGLRFTTCPAATIFGEIANQRAHCGIVGGIEQPATFTLACNEAGARQMSKVERQCGRCHPDTITKHTRGKAISTRLNERTISGEAMDLGQRGQPVDGIRVFYHISIIVEI